MALLVVLFVFAIKPASLQEVAKVNLAHEKRPEKIPVVHEKATLDQVDNLLSKFVAEEVKAQVEAQIIHPEKPQPVPSNTIEIIVKQGDTLEKIAKKSHTNVGEIMKINRLVDSRLHIGQILYVPEVEESIEAKPVAPATATNSNLKYYIVKHGDNPWTIAIKSGIKVEELLKLNNLDESKAKKLKPGDKLRIQ
jgi:peptidoglycan endopeptidase LytF